MKWFAILALTAASACGVDGPPERPAPAPKTAGHSSVAISGDARVGVVTGL